MSLPARFPLRGLGPALCLVFVACSSHPLVQPSPTPEQETALTVAINPERAIDIVFLVDNSPSMDPKQASLRQKFPLMIEELKKLPEGLPDVHIGIVDSDVGAGPTSLGGNCSRVLGDQGKFQAKAGCGLAPGALWIEQTPGKAPNFTGDITDVFSCLADVGVGGCGYEHQLQAVRVALSEGTRPEHIGFLRPDAYLAIIIVSDEDDCSADPQSTMFEDRLPDETASLRCATRGHVCSGKTLEYPTTQAFEDDFANCEARDDSGLPLIHVQDFVDSIRSVKPRPDEQILVAAIVGWPADGNLDGLKYRIDKDPTAPAGETGKWDYMPICEIPSITSADGNIYKAYGGLRFKKFVDAFGANGSMFSLCGSDFTAPMQKIGEKLRRKLEAGCVDAPFIDSDHDPSNGVQPDCKVVQRIPNGKTYDESVLPQCTDGGPRPCWQLTQDWAACPATGQKIDSVRPIDPSTGAPAAPPVGTLLDMHCLTCSDPAICNER